MKHIKGLDYNNYKVPGREVAIVYVGFYRCYFYVGCFVKINSALVWVDINIII